MNRCSTKPKTAVCKEIAEPETVAVSPVDEISATRLEELITFLKYSCPKSDKEAIIAAVKKTYCYRRQNVSKILVEFPKFAEAPYLVNFLITMIKWTNLLICLTYHT